MASKKSTQQSSTVKANKRTPMTQRFIEIAEFANDTVVMKDGSLRAVLLVSSINFFLKSDDEQEAIIHGYQQFLNTIDFQLEIIVQSRKFDIAKYLAYIEKLEKQQTNDLLKLQMTDYRRFVGELIDLGQIMDKRFYVVVPYHPVGDLKRGFLAQTKALFIAAAEMSLKKEQFLKRKHFLDLRVEHVVSGLRSMGISAARLDTQALIELFYSLYNQDTAPNQKLGEVNELWLES